MTMDAARGIVWTAVGVILLTAIVSGPLVGAVDLTTPRDAGPGISFGAGDELDASVVSLPQDDIRLEAGRYGAGTYYLRVPDAVVDIKRVRGSPRLVYKLRIDRLGYVRATVHFVDREHEGERLHLALEPDTFAPDRIEGDAYDGTLLVVARTDRNATTLARQNVTVEVR